MFKNDWRRKEDDEQAGETDSRENTFNGPFAVSDEGTFYETGDDEDARIDRMAHDMGY